MIDLEPAAARVARVFAEVDDDQLGTPTPCGTSSVGDVIDHIATMATAFTGKARKDIYGPAGSGSPPPPSAANLGEGWREQVAQRLQTLAAAWAEPSAWEGMTNAGGLDLPADVAGLVVLDELIIHGWDVAVATGVDYQVPEDE